MDIEKDKNGKPVKFICKDIKWDTSCDDELDESVSKRDDIDAEADNKKEKAKADYEKDVDDADADRDDKLGKQRLNEEPIYGLQSQYDSRKSFGGKAQVDVSADGETLYSYDTPVAHIKDGKVTLLPKWDLSQTTLRHVKEFLKQHGFKAESRNQMAADYVSVQEEGCQRRAKKLKEDHKRDTFLNATSKVEKKEFDALIAKGYTQDQALDKMVKDRTTDPEDGSGNAKKDKAKIKSDIKKRIGLTEDFKEVSVTTDDQHMEMTSDENGKVTVTTEPIHEEAETSEDDRKEIIAPISDATANDIVGEEEAEGEFPEDGQDTDIDIEEFDEEEFDNLGESYLKRVYDNVNSFKTTSGKIENNKLILEGLIEFASGKKAKTSFIFEGKTITKTGKIKLLGENKQISNNKRAFTLTGKMNGKKLITESLTYNYRGLDAKTNKSTRLYGTVKSK